ncbi:MAG TPA: ankyrin repeat domain-containing protein [Pyrinomonadaceae bacterium]|nr:ankyrin repeat domain-containing protein [Pyrinomonadaceae bacterium]
MLVLHKFFLFSLLGLLFVQGTTNTKQELNDQLFEAVRKGDAAAVAALLDKGADVNAKFRYGQTALFKAAEKGNASVAKVLLDRGADVTVKDTFYGATAMTWAMSNGHTDVVRLLFEKDSSNADEVLMTGVRSSNEELVKVVLNKGGAKPQTLTAALVASMANPKNAGIVELLKKAGAVAPPEVDAATMQSYVGKYKGDTGPELSITVKEGKLIAISPQAPNPILLMAIDKTSFRPVEFEGITLTFNVEGGNVTGLAFKQGPNTTQMKRLPAETKP